MAAEGGNSVLLDRCRLSVSFGVAGRGRAAAIAGLAVPSRTLTPLRRFSSGGVDTPSSQSNWDRYFISRLNNYWFLLFRGKCMIEPPDYDS